MLKRFNESAEAEAENRTRGLAALKFRAGGQGQWDDNIYDLRGENNQPRESYNQIPQFVHQVTNDMRMNMGEVKFIASKDGTVEVAKVYEDLVRNIQASSEAEVAFDTAADSQVTIGWGYWRLITEYENDDTFDQIIKFMWVPNAFTVYDDPSSKQQDRMDRQYLIQVSDIRLGDFNADREKSDRYDGADLQSIGDGYPDWASDWDEGDEAYMRIAEYWEVKETKKYLYRINGKVTSKKPKGEVKDEDKREYTERKVIWRKCTGKEVLEEREWPGKYIPYCFVAGEQLNIDGKWYLSGLVEHMMSPQRQYNYWTNAATEAVSLIPNAPYMVDPAQIEGYEQWWDKANIKKYPYLPARRFGKNGVDYGMPQRTNTGVDIAAMAQLIQNAQQNFYTTTGIYPASLGKQGNEVSGKAIQARQKEGDVSTFHFADNISRAQRACGRILEDLIKKIYDGARVVKLLKEDKTTASLPVNQDIKDPKTGKTLNLDLTLGTYDVMVTTGANFTTKRQEEQDALLQLAGTTNLMEIAPDIFYSKQDWSGADELAERYKKALPPQLLGEDDQIPPQIKMAMQQSQQMIQQLTQELQQAQQQLQSKQADLQLKAADLQIKQQDQAQSAQSDATKAQTDQMKLQLDAQKLQLESEKLQLEREAVELDRLRLQVEAMTPKTIGQPANQNIEGDDEMNIQTASREQLMQQLQMLDQQEQDKQMQAQQQQMMQQQQADKEAQEMQNSQMLLQQLAGIQHSLAALTQSIQATKTVVRDPKTGLIAGVATING